MSINLLRKPVMVGMNDLREYSYKFVQMLSTIHIDINVGNTIHPHNFKNCEHFNRNIK